MNDLEMALYFFAYIMIELTILFIGITFLVGIIQQYVSPERIKSTLSKKRRGLGNVMGASFGAVTPFCSCSTIPLLLGMLDSGVPFGVCMSFLIASPLLNPVIIGMLLTMIPIELLALYFIVTFFGSVIIGMLLQRLGFEKEIKNVKAFGANDDRGKCTECKCNTTAWKRNQWKIKRAFGSSIKLFRQMLVYMIIGVAIGAFIYGFVPEDIIASIAGPGNPLAIPVAAVVGIPMYVRAETIIPIGIALISKGMSTGAVVALLIGGAGASIPEVIMLSGIFKKKLVATFVLTILSIAVMTGLIIEFAMVG